VSTGTRDVDVDLAAARHQLPGAPPQDHFPCSSRRSSGHYRSAKTPVSRCSRRSAGSR
jgi:hypothetical protein